MKARNHPTPAWKWHSRGRRIATFCEKLVAGLKFYEMSGCWLREKAMAIHYRQYRTSSGESFDTGCTRQSTKYPMTFDTLLCRLRIPCIDPNRSMYLLPIRPRNNCRSPSNLERPSGTLVRTCNMGEGADPQMRWPNIIPTNRNITRSLFLSFDSLL